MIHNTNKGYPSSVDGHADIESRYMIDNTSKLPFLYF